MEFEKSFITKLRYSQIKRITKRCNTCTSKINSERVIDLANWSFFYIYKNPTVKFKYFSRTFQRILSNFTRYVCLWKICNSCREKGLKWLFFQWHLVIYIKCVLAILQYKQKTIYMTCFKLYSCFYTVLDFLAKTKLIIEIYIHGILQRFKGCCFLFQ